MRKIKILLLILCVTISFAVNSQSKVAHINSTELVSSMPEMNEAKSELEKLAKETEDMAGYDRVRTPHITKGNLYEQSGHLSHYKDSMFPAMDIDGNEYYLKPMNCPHHHKIYASSPRTYL